MRAALSHHDPANGASAPPAFFPRPSVHRKLELVLPARTVGAPVIPQCGAARIDRARQRPARRIQNRGCTPRRPVSRNQRVHACKVQRFVDVDVSESGHEVLVEQQSLHRRTASREPRGQRIRVQLEWIGSDTQRAIHGGSVPDEDETETARIEVPQLRAVGEMPAGVQMLFPCATTRRRVGIPFQTARHSQMNDQAIGRTRTRLQRNDDRLAATGHALHARIRQGGDLPTPGTVEVGGGQRCPRDAPARQLLAQLAHHRLDFGQFRHDARSIHRP